MAPPVPPTATVYLVFNANGALHLSTTDQRIATQRGELIEGLACGLSASMDFTPKPDPPSSGS